MVAGGGPAGMAAAVTAARLGADVFLAEGVSTFGGMGTAGGLPFFCRPTDGRNFLAAGFGEEVYDRIWRAGGAGPEMNFREHPEEIGGFIYDPETLKRVYDNLATEAGFRFTFNTALIDVQAEGGRMTHAVCAAKSGIFAVAAQIFIDATGDGDLAALAGAPYEKGDVEGLMQAGTLCSLWNGIDWTRKKIWTDGSWLAEAFERDMFSFRDLGLPGILHTRGDCGWGNVGHAFYVDGTDERSVTAALVDVRRRISEYEAYYRNFVPGCEHATVQYTAQSLGIRETRRIMGDYVLNVEDFRHQAVFEDEIGRFAYPVDLHAPGPGAEVDAGQNLFHTLHYRNPGESYGIPYRCLVPRTLDNVFVAGRCVSTDRYLQGSLRVQPGCHITGQAAGAAAALASARKCATRELPVELLQQKLTELGAFLPNFRRENCSCQTQTDGGIR